MNESTGAVYRTLTADRGDARQRLDRVIQRHLAADRRAATRARVQRWIERGHVSVNGVAVRRAAARTALGDVVTICWPPGEEPSPPPPAAAEEAPLDLLYEDDDLLAVNKPAGVVVHPTYGHARGTIMNALLWRARGWPAGTRPSLVGRLDRLTSGLVLVARTARAHAALQRVLAAPISRKEYLALVHGRPPARGRIDLGLRRDPGNRRRVVASPAGSPSLTEFERIARGRGVSLLRCRLRTGRMHQIRAHLAAGGWPIVGDPVYGARRQPLENPIAAARLLAFPRQALHAWRLSFPHPTTGRQLEIEAPVPADLSDLFTALGWHV